VEGVGTVLESRFAGLQPGQRVLLPAGFGTWRARGVVGGAQLIPVPEQVDPRQAAMLRINPATAHCMLLALVNLPAGAWVVQNAANSGVGRAVIQIARILGLRTVNVVRREGLDSDLERLGADTVLVEGPGLARRIRERTGTAELRLALNAVGGDCALELAKALDESGTLVTYGAMARQPLRIPNGLLIFRDLKLRGFWVSRWYRDADPGRVRALFDDLLKWVAEGKICTPVEAVYPLAHIRDAIQHAGRDFRSGKILLQPEKDWDCGSSLE
jgi:NADPH:quinone reductase-like Zn-dependent oxidoreductase